MLSTNENREDKHVLFVQVVEEARACLKDVARKNVKKLWKAIDLHTKGVERPKIGCRDSDFRLRALRLFSAEWLHLEFFAEI